MRLLGIGLLMAVVTSGQAPVLPSHWGAVLPHDQALTFARPRLCNRPAPGPVTGTWVPDPDTIRRLELVLAVELQTAIDIQSDPNRRLLAVDYYRQYAGLVIGGRRIVYVNGLHRYSVEQNQSSSWRTVAGHACDGGLRFFGAEYDVETGVVSKIFFNGGGRGLRPWGSASLRGEAVPPPLATLLYRTPYEGRLQAWCTATLASGAPPGFAVALLTAKGTHYAVVDGDAGITMLADYAGQPDLSCHSRRDAEKLSATIRASETIEGSVTPRWDSTVICGFVRDTEAVCWQYSSEEKRFVRVGGWVT